ncbi:MAG: hypothetical protein ACJ751_29440 [Niastella sp.]|uniref:hypothetical protein n=1 Tax=Niastella sp. TaxID=1869183 RepID=UPI0038999A7E
MKGYMVMLLFLCGKVLAQDGQVAHFSFWKPKPGEEKKFENGYKQHLNWHKTNGDKWAWYGWYIISGPRSGQFVDATFNHAWSDFDKPVKPAEDYADNQLHTYPFGDYIAGCKWVYLTDLSLSDSNSLQSKFLRLVSIHITDMAIGKKVIEKLKSKYKAAGTGSFMTFKLVDGGELNQFLLLIGVNNFSSYSQFVNLEEELSGIEASMKIKAIRSVTSETLAYRADMSLFPN